MPGSPRLSALALAASLLALAPLSAQDFGQRAADHGAALPRYKELLLRKPFQHHYLAREYLASTGDAQAIPLLVEEFKKVKEYRDPSRYHLAKLLGTAFPADQVAPVLRPLRVANGKPGDTWLWVHSLRAEASAFGNAEVLKVVLEDKSPYHQAAAIVALSMRQADELWDAMFHVATNFPTKTSDRYLLLGAMSGAVVNGKSKVRSDRARTGMHAYISLLAPAVKLEHLAKVQMARHLQIALDGPGLLVDPEPWLLLLQQPGKKSTGGNTVSQPRFFGIETEGERFCYVVDLSNSMLQEIAPEVIPKGPTTGPKKKPQKGELLDENDLPWHTIKTRFDLAREHLKLSLMRLPEDKYFSVVWFGDSSGTLPSCPGLIKATKGNVQKVCKDLDSIEVGPKNPPKDPFGVLRGDTNLHSGVMRAFALSGKGFVESDAFVDPGPLVEGCDTIFLLSDGAPSTDDYNCPDKDYGEGNVVLDRESGAAAARTPIINYHGPFVFPSELVGDIERMNTFRRVRIHCIGIGEADENLLRMIAKVGQGQVYMVGKSNKNADKSGR